MPQTVEGRALELSVLTPQERECLRLVAQQRSSKEIARELGISKASVDTYCNRARAKLGVDNRRAAAQLMIARETNAGVSPRTPAASAPAPVPVPVPAVAAVSVLPPLSSLGPVARLGIILAGAVVLALAFGMLLSGLQTLNGVVEASNARGVPSAAALHAR